MANYAVPFNCRLCGCEDYAMIGSVQLKKQLCDICLDEETDQCP